MSTNAYAKMLSGGPGDQVEEVLGRALQGRGARAYGAVNEKASDNDDRMIGRIVEVVRNVEEGGSRGQMPRNHYEAGVPAYSTGR